VFGAAVDRNAVMRNRNSYDVELKITLVERGKARGGRRATKDTGECFLFKNGEQCVGDCKGRRAR